MKPTFEEMPQIKLDSTIGNPYLNIFFANIYDLCSAYFVGNVLYDIVQDQSIGVMGYYFISNLSSFYFWIHWFLSYAFLAFIQSWGLVLIFFLNKFAIRSSILLVFLNIFFFLLVFKYILLKSSVTFMQFLSVLIRKKNYTITIGFFSTFFLGILYIPVIIFNGPIWIRQILCLLPSIGAVQSKNRIIPAFLLLVELEGINLGLNVSTLNYGEFKLGSLLIIQIISIIMWILLCLYFDKLYPAGSLEGKKWNFIFKCIF